MPLLLFVSRNGTNLSDVISNKKWEMWGGKAKKLRDSNDNDESHVLTNGIKCKSWLITRENWIFLAVPPPTQDLFLLLDSCRIVVAIGMFSDYSILVILFRDFDKQICFCFLQQWSQLEGNILLTPAPTFAKLS